MALQKVLEEQGQPADIIHKKTQVINYTKQASKVRGKKKNNVQRQNKWNHQRPFINTSYQQQSQVPNKNTHIYK